MYINFGELSNVSFVSVLSSACSGLRGVFNGIGSFILDNGRKLIEAIGSLKERLWTRQSIRPEIARIASSQGVMPVSDISTICGKEIKDTFTPFLPGHEFSDNERNAYSTSAIDSKETLFFEGEPIKDAIDLLVEDVARRKASLRRAIAEETDEGNLAELQNRMKLACEATLRRDFDVFLERELDQLKLEPSENEALKTAISALFSSTANVLLGQRVAYWVYSNYEGMFNPGKILSETCDLSFDKEKNRVQITAKYKVKNSDFCKGAQAQKLTPPIVVDASVTYTMERDGAITAAANYRFSV